METTIWLAFILSHIRFHLKAELLHTGNTVVGQAKYRQILSGVRNYVVLCIPVFRIFIFQDASRTLVVIAFRMNLWSRFLHGKCRGYFRFNAICTLNQTVCSSYIIFKCSLCCQCIVIAILLSKLLWIGFVIRITVNLTINIYRTAFIIFYLTSKGAEYQFYANRIFDAFLL